MAASDRLQARLAQLQAAATRYLSKGPRPQQTLEQSLKDRVKANTSIEKFIRSAGGHGSFQDIMGRIGIQHVNHGDEILYFLPKHADMVPPAQSARPAQPAQRPRPQQSVRPKQPARPQQSVRPTRPGPAAAGFAQAVPAPRDAYDEDVRAMTPTVGASDYRLFWSLFSENVANVIKSWVDWPEDVDGSPDELSALERRREEVAALISEVTLQLERGVMLTSRTRDGAFGHAMLPCVVQRTDIEAVMRGVAAAWGFGGDSRELIGEDNRVGVPGTLHRVSVLRPIAAMRALFPEVGATIRMGKWMPGVSRGLMSDTELVDMATRRLSLLIVGPPGVGKTTIIRDLASRMSTLRKTVVVDTSLEIGGGGLAAHPSLGLAIRIQVESRQRQDKQMAEGVINHGAEVLVVDEVSNKDEATMARDIARRGVTFIASVHAVSLGALAENANLSALVGGRTLVTVSDHTVRDTRTSANIYQDKTRMVRKEEPCFQWALVWKGESQWAVVKHVRDAVDDAIKAMHAEA